MKTYRLATAAALFTFLYWSSEAQEAPEEQTPPPAAEQEQAPPAAEEENRTLEQIFIPSEEIRADEEVTFPINI